jgi:phosphoribosylglycinamide formyltransferase-1
MEKIELSGDCGGKNMRHKAGGVYMEKKLRIGALVSGGGSNLQAIIDSCGAGKIDGRIVFVGSDNPHSAALLRAKKHSIPVFVVEYKSIIRNYRQASPKPAPPDDFDLGEAIAKQSFFHPNAGSQKLENFLITRAIAEANLLREMKAHDFDLLILAGFMRNLTPYFIDRVNHDRTQPRIMNIHPALLPAFPGIDGYGDTLRYGCKVGGCTVHFIDYGEDTGPIIGQRAFQIQQGDTLEIVRQRGLALEWQLYTECIQLFAQGRLRVVQRCFKLPNGRKFTRSVVEVAGYKYDLAPT